MPGNSLMVQLGARQLKRTFAQVVNISTVTEKPLHASHDSYGLADDRLGKRRPGSDGASAFSADMQTKSDNPLFLFEEAAGADDESLELEPSNHGQESPMLADIDSPESADSSSELFAEFKLDTSDSQLLSGFLHQLGSTPVLAALAQLEQWHLHPVGDGDYCSLECTVAGMLVLARRAAVTAEELTPELLLTLLWLLESAHGSQYRSLKNCLVTYLRLNADRSKRLLKRYKRRMIALQMEVLRRADWRVLLRDQEELFAALADLGTLTGFDQVCSYVEECAKTNRLPLGTHGHSPAAAAAMEAAAHGAARGGHDSQESPAPSGKRGQTGLDGSYWQLAAQPPPGQGRLLRSVLAPRNAYV